MPRKLLMLPLLLAAAVTTACDDDPPPRIDLPGYVKITPDPHDYKPYKQDTNTSTNNIPVLKVPGFEDPAASEATTRPIIRVEIATTVDAGGTRLAPDAAVLNTGESRRLTLGPANRGNGAIAYEVGQYQDGFFQVRLYLRLASPTRANAQFIARLSPHQTQDFMTIADDGTQINVRIHLEALDPLPIEKPKFVPEPKNDDK
jgi:hypothetical protein